MDGTTLLRILAALGVIVLLLAALAVVLRFVPRYFPGGLRGRLITLIETTMLPNAAALHVVRILDQYYVIGSASGQVSVVCPISKEQVEERFASSTMLRR